MIRVSGPEAFTICDKLFQPAGGGKPLEEQKAKTLHYGAIRRGEEQIDDVVVGIFRAPHSFTGEDTVEISCHGSVYIQQRILQALVESGCRLAKPGEFTQRAFLNGKMDLSQAEAVADLIASTSEGQHRLALSQMRGGFSKELAKLRDKLLHITSLMELELDFSDHEELEFADRGQLLQLAEEVESAMSRLKDSFSMGNAIKNGIPVAIIGETNAGKSTLLNALLNEEKAIVSDIKGTTRDAIEDVVNINGQLFRFIDTAGIRETSDEIENLGIERTFMKIGQANVVLWMVDYMEAEGQISRLKDKIVPVCRGKQLILLLNKVDLTNTSQEKPSLSVENIPVVPISAKEKINIGKLKQLLSDIAQTPVLSQNNVIVTNVRHYEALTSALSAIRRVQDGLSAGLSGDFISQDLRECIFHLSDIIGEVTTDEVLENIFNHFCIGK